MEERDDRRGEVRVSSEGREYGKVKGTAANTLSSPPHLFVAGREQPGKGGVEEVGRGSARGSVGRDRGEGAEAAPRYGPGVTIAGCGLIGASCDLRPRSRPQRGRPVSPPGRPPSTRAFTHPPGHVMPLVASWRPPRPHGASATPPASSRIRKV
ncbi:hypothetical protein E2C01_041823 [Portunus trituberculatus]|uniref:Uncharacterized protein n=1 Tax=Portunus trituberculatus TaxID=210409 RepID=A0A5B7FSW1_PORTR|nr:hypothetical protein [Portunus trituberculatus]